MKKKWLVIALFLCTLIGVTPSALATTTSDAGADANLDAAAVVAPETDVAPTVGAVPVSDVAPTAEADMERLKIQFENGIHYIEDPDYPGKKITLFCMNNLSHWPHHTPDMGDLQVPDYIEGYLTPEHFESEEDYNECMRRLSKLLYAGYPYNGEDLYKIVANSSEYTPTEEEFNKMLVCPPVLQTAYPYLGHHDFSYEDWKSQNKEHLEQLRKFTGEVIKLNISGGTTSNGLTYEDIAAMPFYKAAFSITNCNNQTPLQTFQYFYGASYFVTEDEAYNATQGAIWHLLWSYNIPDNNLSSMSLPLSKVLYTYAERGGLLTHEPSFDEIQVVGDKTFTYNPKDAMWHSGSLHIEEPDDFRGLYNFEFPEGMSALCDNLTHVYGDEEYEIVSDHQPKVGEQIVVTADFKWLKEVKQYSPFGDPEYKGKKFQHMIGAVVNDKTLKFLIPFELENVGDLEISKKVLGEKDSAERFNFKISLYDMTDPDKPKSLDIDGLYGDFEFHHGVAYFDLAANETKRAINIPAGSKYVIEELDLENSETYRLVKPEMGKIEGTIAISEVVTEEFVNERLWSLSVGKVVSGSLGDTAKPFAFEIALADAKGKPVEGKFAYHGSVIDGYENVAQAPEDGFLTFKDGKATINLLHGQQIKIVGLPAGTRYKVTENRDDSAGYSVTYNGAAAPAEGSLTGDVTVKVENNKEPIIVPPNKPDKPDKPDKPEKPEQPDKPDKPDKPEKPEKPDKPDKPEKPEQPENPDNPDKPDNPQNPEKPEQPEDPQKPSEPGKPTDPSRPQGGNGNSLPQTGDNTLAIVGGVSAVAVALLAVGLFLKFRRK